MVDATLSASEESLRGGLNITNPNYNYSGNLVYGGITSTNNDKPDHLVMKILLQI